MSAPCASAPFFRSRTIQPKRIVNEPGDQYEQEADAMADRVMRMSSAASAGGAEQPDATNRPVLIQRKCAACDQEETVQRQETEEKEEPLQTAPLMRKAANDLR